jgi:hypothetical protein
MLLALPKLTAVLVLSVLGGTAGGFPAPGFLFLLRAVGDRLVRVGRLVGGGVYPSQHQQPASERGDDGGFDRDSVPQAVSRLVSAGPGLTSG